MRYNLVVPLCGKGQRMVDGGYDVPKPLIISGDRHILDYGMDCLDTTNCNVIFVVRQEHVCNWAIDKTLRALYGNCEIVVVEGDTKGAVDTCYAAKALIDNDIPLILFTPDVFFAPKFSPTPEMFENDGYIMTFKSNSPNYSYVLKGDDGLVKRTAEKIVISNDANGGVYCFKNGALFCKLARENAFEHGEHHIAPLYNDLIENGGKVRTGNIENMYVMGTPDELSFFERVVYPYLLPRGIIFCSDHSGYELKEKAKEAAKVMSAPYLDAGCYSEGNSDYIDFVKQAMRMRRWHPGYMIMGFSSFGQGINICANKQTNVRGVVCLCAEDVTLGISHNAANFFAVPTGKVLPDALPGMLMSILTTKFAGGRHQAQLSKLEGK